MCWTTTIGGTGGPSDSKSVANAGGPPVEIPIAMHLSANSGGQSLATVFGTWDFFQNGLKRLL